MGVYISIANQSDLPPQRWNSAPQQTHSTKALLSSMRSAADLLVQDDSSDGTIRFSCEQAHFIALTDDNYKATKEVQYFWTILT